MTALALALVLIAAVLHATWNLCAKRAGGGLPFVWLVGAVICTLYVPVLIGYGLTHPPQLNAVDLAWIAGSGLLKTGYSLSLQRSYRTGDFSLIYPLARGTGPAPLDARSRRAAWRTPDAARSVRRLRHRWRRVRADRRHAAVS